MDNVAVSILYSATGIVPLACLLVVAARQDMASATIPNVVVAFGITLAVFLHAILPSGGGFLSPAAGGLGWLASLEGLFIGFAVLFPAYLLRVMGAGDVKLMAMVGAFLGPDDILPALAGTFLAGGGVAVLVALRHRSVLQLFRNVFSMLRLTLYKLPISGRPEVEPPTNSVAKAPYGVAIALGTLGAVGWLIKPMVLV